MRCVACALWMSRLQVGLRRLPELARCRASVDNAFAEGEQRDAALFFGCLLESLRQGELDADRLVAWPHSQRELPFASHVDRLFSFVEETRLRCKVCRSVRSRFATSSVLQLPLAPSDDRVKATCVTELYYLWAARETLSGANAIVCDSDICAGIKTAHKKQVRICKAPNILVVQVRRVEDEQHDVIRHSVVPEEDLSLRPGTIRARWRRLPRRSTANIGPLHVCVPWSRPDVLACQ